MVGVDATAAAETEARAELEEKVRAGRLTAFCTLDWTARVEAATVTAAWTLPAVRSERRRLVVEAERVATHTEEVVAEAACRMDAQTAVEKEESWEEERLE